MDPEKFKKKTKKVAGTTDVDILTVEYLNPKYEIRGILKQTHHPYWVIRGSTIKT